MFKNDREYTEQALDTLPLSDCVLMGPYDAILVELGEQLEWMRETLDILESGKTKILRENPLGNINETPSWIAEQKHRISRLLSVIAAYEKRNVCDTGRPETG